MLFVLNLPDVQNLVSIVLFGEATVSVVAKVVDIVETTGVMTADPSVITATDPVTQWLRAINVPQNLDTLCLMVTLLLILKLTMLIHTLFQILRGIWTVVQITT